MEQSCHILNEYLANLKILDNNLHNMHFNIVGKSFFGLHKKLQEYYEKVLLFYDEIGERIKMLEGYPVTSLIKIEDISTFKSMCSMDFTGEQVFDVLENDFKFITEYSKDLIHHFEEEKDIYTVSIITEQYKFFEKELWMIKSNLK